jgi:hypothetical protein
VARVFGQIPPLKKKFHRINQMLNRWRKVFGGGILLSSCHKRIMLKKGWYCAAAMSYSSAMKIDIEKLDRRVNFGLWNVQVNDVLIQSGLHKALQGNTSNMAANKWEELYLRATSAIRRKRNSGKGSKGCIRQMTSQIGCCW